MAKLTEEERQRRAVARVRQAALAAEERDLRLREQMEKWDREGTRLSREELEAGVSCRGCGEPIIDRRGSWPPLNMLSAEERAEHDAEDVRFRERHAMCHDSRWTLEGSRTSHCAWCCPPPPLSQKQIDRLAEILTSIEKSDRDLDEWRLTLTCDHAVIRTQHRDYKTWSSWQVVDCPTCGARRGIVQSERVGPAEGAGSNAERERAAAELRAAELKLTRQRQAAEKSERLVDQLKMKIEQLS